MNLKKSIFSYITWAAFAFLCCMGTISALDTAEITDVSGWPYAGIIGAVCGYLLLTAAVFFALRALCMEMEEYIRDRARLERAASVVLPAAILIGAVVYLVLYILYHVPLTLKEDSFYRQAVVSAGKSVPFAVHGASWLYPCLLHVMLLIFGNTPFAGVVLQIILFFICLLLLYIGMQAFAGVLPAAVSMALFGFLPVSLQFLFSLTPEFFYLMLYLSGFCLTGILFRNFRKNKNISPAWYLFGFLSGIYIGFLVYLDLYGISLYLFLAVLFSLDREKIKQAAGINLTALFGGAAGFVLACFAASRTGEMDFSVYLEKLFDLYVRNAGLEGELFRNVVLQPDTTFAGSLLLISFAFFVIPAFFIWKRNQNSAFILNLFLVYTLSAFHIFYLNAQMNMTFSWSVLAGLGLYGVVRLPGEEKTDKKKTLDEDFADMNAETKITEKREQKLPAPGQPLHNPLPLPKKKSRPQVDFTYQVKEADMKFDIEVADDDDFDV